MSTGLASINDLEKAISVITSTSSFFNQKDSYALLHCISAYPALDNDLNLLTIRFLKEHFGCLVGYSDHSLGDNKLYCCSCIGCQNY
ncbi:MAG: hypothetical protein OMM_14293 [Candidatus Magnetoglobus multicellularis str. Araruama]|uniref:PseI/NeuA/B-like domain-containing protein n=1 Tax=Candidatus Magnetoglobus multicellularis str. Araruama TaxID=890399 RepID=A0A1V1NS51_9BACT|nr:MAG: hypothetical protein OMM_14293 [Candidatus Magnetoglobus multicellularis str. Araruama]